MIPDFGHRLQGLPYAYLAAWAFGSPDYPCAFAFAPLFELDFPNLSDSGHHARMTVFPCTAREDTSDIR